MADLSTALVAHLESSAGVAALVGTRIWSDQPPQEYSVTSGAALIYYVIDTQHENMINGLAGLARCRVEFTSYGATRATAEAVAEAVRTSGLVGFVGDLHGVWIESVTIDSGIQQLTESPTDGSQEHRYLTVFDYLFCYQETRQ